VARTTQVASKVDHLVGSLGTAGVDDDVRCTHVGHRRHGAARGRTCTQNANPLETVDTDIAKRGTNAGNVGVGGPPRGRVGRSPHGVRGMHATCSIIHILDNVENDFLQRHREAQSPPLLVETGEERSEVPVVALDRLVRPIQTQLGVGRAMQVRGTTMGYRRAKNGGAGHQPFSARYSCN